MQKFVISQRIKNQTRQFASTYISPIVSSYLKIKTPKVFVFGNQKAGTSAIANLLAIRMGIDATIDIPSYWLEEFHKVSTKQQSILDFVSNHKIEFSRGLIKEPYLTYSAHELINYFSDSSFVFVIRDPRENIRSILNRLATPGHLQEVRPSDIQKPASWKYIMETEWFDVFSKHYIEALAFRWKLASRVYINNPQSMHLAKYEDFLEGKVGFINSLANEIGSEWEGSIEQYKDIQFQPRGEKVDWLDFYGEHNLQLISDICCEELEFFDYPI